MFVLRMLGVVRTSFLVILGLVVLAQPALAARPHRAMSPFLAMGPRATLADIASPQYSVFTCQVIGRSPGTTCYDPYQMQHAYQTDTLIAAGYDGTGQTIVIVDAFQNPHIQAAVDAFSAFYGLPPLALTQIAPDGLTPFDPNDDNMFGWAGEITLDVEWAHAIAPRAKIVLVLAKTNNDDDILSAVKYAVDHDLGSVISMSFGENESCSDPDILSAYHDVFAAATKKNITLFASSGDDGAAQSTCDGASWVRAASSPASDPLVTGVGGTELNAARYCLTSLGCNPSANPAPGTYLGELAWNEGAIGYGATGGGFSVLFDQPPYQKAFVGGKQRAVPDVSYNAAVNHGVLTYLDIPGISPGFYLFGGTSAGAPQWAAITAIANQKAGKRLGFLNSAIYQIGKVKKTYPVSFHDVTDGNNSVVLADENDDPVEVDGFAAGAGWDAPTGTGSPIAPTLADLLLQYVSPGDGVSAVATTKPKPHAKPVVRGHMDSH